MYYAIDKRNAFFKEEKWLLLKLVYTPSGHLCLQEIAIYNCDLSTAAAAAPTFKLEENKGAVAKEAHSIIDHEGRRLYGRIQNSFVSLPADDEASFL